MALLISSGLINLPNSTSALLVLFNDLLLVAKLLPKAESTPSSKPSVILVLANESIICIVNPPGISARPALMPIPAAVIPSSNCF